uniref:Immunoglobulin domain-containing protein n=1 Tax=Cyprinus carpio TaxID=7962 RepID=A0A8C1VP44_CYPCA
MNRLKVFSRWSYWIILFCEQFNKMFHIFLLRFCWWHLIGVFGAENNEIQSMSVMEGDSVLLNNDFTEICENDHFLWNIRNETTSLVAKINKQKQFLVTYDGLDGRFRNRLKLNNQTGSLTITNITTQHTGLYEVKIIGRKELSKTFNVSVYAVISSNSSQCSSSSTIPSATRLNIWTSLNSVTHVQV